MATVTPETIAIPESIASSIQEATENAEEATGNPEQATENRTSLDVLLDLTPPRPTLYHLPASQSQCILWLLEELDIEYNLQYNLHLIPRNPTSHTAPAEVPPQLKTGGGLIIIGTSAIIYYLLRTYDTDNKFAARDPLRDEIMTSFASTTLGPLITLEFVLDFAAKYTPWPFVYFSRYLRKQIQNEFTRKQLKFMLSWLEGTHTQLEGGEYFNGREIGRSDIMLTWPLDLIAARNWADIRDHPWLTRWRTQIQLRPAWQRALEKGNGYDLAAW